jgi:hypothetical protein
MRHRVLPRPVDSTRHGADRRGEQLLDRRACLACRAWLRWGSGGHACTRYRARLTLGAVVHSGASYPQISVAGLRRPGKAGERSRTPSFWVVDPVANPYQASLSVWELGLDGRYHTVAEVTGEDMFTAKAPYAVTVVPADLVR